MTQSEQVSAELERQEEVEAYDARFEAFGLLSRFLDSWQSALTPKAQLGLLHGHADKIAKELCRDEFVYLPKFQPDGTYIPPDERKRVATHAMKNRALIWVLIAERDALHRFDSETYPGLVLASKAAIEAFTAPEPK